MGLISAFYIAQRGLNLSQTALETISHNIANVNTEGYSRQRVDLETTPPYQTRFGQLGTGVTAQSVTRMYDQYIQNNLIEKNSRLAKYEAQKLSIDALEAVFNESQGNGINEALSEFWNAWQEVANNPDGAPERVNLLEKAQTLTDHIQRTRLDMDAIKEDVNQRIEEATTQVNTLIQKIAELNEKIVSSESGFLESANDLRDSRNQHILELAEFLDIDFFEDPSSGAVSVLTKKGTPLVMGSSAWEIRSTRDANNDIRLEWVRPNGGTVDVTDNISSGRLGGWIELRDEFMFDYYSQFDAFTENLILEVNRQHTQGVGLTKYTDLTGTYDISTYASFQTDMFGDNNDITFTALTEGDDAHKIGIQFVKAARPSQQLAVSVTQSGTIPDEYYNITVTLPVNENGDIDATAEEVIRLINENVSDPQPDFPPAAPTTYLAGDLLRATLARGERGDTDVTELTGNPDDPAGLGFYRLNHNLENVLEFGDEITFGYENARLETSLYGDDNDLVWTARETGAAGEAVSIEYVDPGAANQALSVTVVGGAVTINLATDASGNIITTAEDIISAVSNNAAASALVGVDRAAGDTGDGPVTAMSARFLDRSGSFDLHTYDADGRHTVTRIIVNPDDTREDILDQIGDTFSTGVAGISAEIIEDTGEHFLRIRAQSGYEFAFSNDNSSALTVLGINTFFEGINNATISVNGMIEDNVSLIASGRVDEDGLTLSGDNENALDLADIKDRQFDHQGQASTISEAYNTLLSGVGADTHSTTSSYDFNQSLVDQIYAQRDMVSAVNLDEEMADMMRFQYMYQASAKMISAADELLQTLLSLR